MLARGNTCLPSISNSASRARSNRAAASAASARSVTPSSRTANSSPPKRATVSVGRIVALRRDATSRRTRSPAGWPRLSLTVLNSSRSMNMTATAAPDRSSAGERVLDTIGEERSVGEVRHGVVEGLVGELLLEHLPLADVAAVQDDSPHVLVVRAGPRAGSRTGATYRRDAAASSSITCASEPFATAARDHLREVRCGRSSSSSRSNCVPSISSTLYPSTRSIDGL